MVSIGLKVEIVLAAIFVAFLIGYLLKNRREIALQKILFPFVYIFMLRRKWGIRTMKAVSEKYREIVKLFGYIGIGVGFCAMGFVVYLFFQLGALIFTQPAKAASPLALPFITIPGFGFLGFTHWILALAFLIIVHEFAHGIVSKAHGVPIRSSGLAILSLIAPIFPAAFVEPDEKKLRKESDVVQYSVFAAGSFMNLIWFLIFALIINLLITPGFNAVTEPSGFSFDLVNSTTPAALAGAGNLSRVNYVDGEPTAAADDMLTDVYYRLDPGDPIELGYMNATSGNLTTYTVITGSAPEDPDRAYLGIINIQNRRDFKDGWRPYGPFLIWIKDLFKWLLLFNFMVGIINMVPLFITDGGQMLRLALIRILGNEQKANKATLVVSILFGGILLISLSLWLGSAFSALVGLF